jgi:hypothetical protein
MLACLELSAPLETEDFRIWKQTRTGLLSYPLEVNAARAHLASSIYVQMALKPRYCPHCRAYRRHHAATAHDVIEASLMAQRVIENALHGQPAMLDDPRIQKRKEHLIQQAAITLKPFKISMPIRKRIPDRRGRAHQGGQQWNFGCTAVMQ